MANAALFWKPKCLTPFKQQGRFLCMGFRLTLHLGLLQQMKAPREAFQLPAPSHIVSFPTDTEPSKAWGSVLLLPEVILPAHLESLLRDRNSSSSQGKGNAQIMRNGYFLLNRMRQKFVMWFPDMTEAKRRSEVATQAFCHTALAQCNIACISYAGGWCLAGGRATRAYVNWSCSYASAGTGVGKKLSGAWTAQI